MKSLSSKSPKSPRTSPTHRIYVAKHDYTPSQSSLHASDHLPVTHSLLPDLPLFSGDTVVAIGNPDEREDGKAGYVHLYRNATSHFANGYNNCCLQFWGESNNLSQRVMVMPALSS